MSTHRFRDAAGNLVVTIARDEHRATATIDDQPHAVERLAFGPQQRHAGAVSTSIGFSVNDQPTTAIVTRHRGQILVAIDGAVYAFASADDDTGAGHARAGSGSVLAPMPGKIVAVLVAEGDTVEAGAGVVVLEAMKMESTLASEIDGVVAHVHVAPGQAVDGGSVLVEIRPAADGSD